MNATTPSSSNFNALEGTLHKTGFIKKFFALAPAVLVCACATQSPATDSTSRVDTSTDTLSCLLPSNCVNSFDSLGLAPLRYEGTSEQAMATLKATIATFPEAKILVSQPLYLETIFTTSIGFQDQVEFMIDEPAKRIDFRSRSKFGLFDFGKNRSRMGEFSASFAKQQAR
jgi:uncharacterized protein (DUF1499 family)